MRYFFVNLFISMFAVWGIQKFWWLMGESSLTLLYSLYSISWFLQFAIIMYAMQKASYGEYFWEFAPNESDTYQQKKVGE